MDRCVGVGGYGGMVGVPVHAWVRVWVYGYMGAGVWVGGEYGCVGV